MITWTDAAKQTLEEYCRRTRENLNGSGADPDEVIDDLRRHVDEELRAANLTVVTEEDVRRILARVGEPLAAGGQPQPSSPSAPGKEEKPSRKKPGMIFLVAAFLFGILLPAGTLIFEMKTGISAGVLFDPIPGWFSLFAVALVPIVNCWLAFIAIKGSTRFPNLAGWLSGAVMGICLFYSILYACFLPIACIAVIWFGLGLIPLAPYLGLIFTQFLRRAAGRSLGSPLKHPWSGFWVAMLTLTLARVPTALTYYGMSAAISEDSTTRARGLNLLRYFGDRELLLRDCYVNGDRERGFDLVRIVAGEDKNITTDQAREIYYRVTGKPFNSLPAPALYGRYGRWTAMDEEFTWDDALGGETVAGRVKGLSLLDSRLDAIVEPDAATTYCEWTLEFKNVSSIQREARAQIALPPGGVVSRLTLWVNGEEQEAAFGGRSEVRQAYQEVAVVQRHDPVLVTTCGPDRVLAQCFPVPPNGGTMKVRIGITTPLKLDSLARGHFAWPKFIERNFSITPDFKYSVWIDSPQKISENSKSLVTENSKGKTAVHGDIPESELSDVIVERNPEVKDVWTPALETGQIIQQHIQPAETPHASRIIFVIDGSIGMEKSKNEIADAMDKVPFGTDIGILIADDKPLLLIPKPASADDALRKSLSSGIRKASFSGGQDNLPALAQAWDLASAAETSAIIWIHDAQPVLLSSADSLLQRLERGGKKIPLYDLQVSTGPNRIIEKLDGFSSIKPVLIGGKNFTADIENLFEILEGKATEYEFAREKLSADSAPTHGVQASRHIERLWARDEARKLTRSRHRDDAIRLAAKQQLVTPVTGAVVLETKQQFAANGLEPVSMESVPMIPEPSMTCLLTLGVALLLYHRMKKERATSRTH